MTFPIEIDFMAIKVKKCSSCGKYKICHPVPEGWVCQSCWPNYFASLKCEHFWTPCKSVLYNGHEFCHKCNSYRKIRNK